MIHAAASPRPGFYNWIQWIFCTDDLPLSTPCFRNSYWLSQQLSGIGICEARRTDASCLLSALYWNLLWLGGRSKTHGLHRKALRKDQTSNPDVVLRTHTKSLENKRTPQNKLLFTESFRQKSQLLYFLQVLRTDASFRILEKFIRISPHRNASISIKKPHNFLKKERLWSIFRYSDKA